MSTRFIYLPADDWPSGTEAIAVLRAHEARHLRAAIFRLCCAPLFLVAALLAVGFLEGRVSELYRECVFLSSPFPAFLSAAAGLERLRIFLFLRASNRRSRVRRFTRAELGGQNLESVWVLLSNRAREVELNGPFREVEALGGSGLVLLADGTPTRELTWLLVPAKSFHFESPGSPGPAAIDTMRH